jgi:hypothetical protein
VLLSLAHLCWLQSRSGSELRRIFALAARSEASRAAIAEHERIDRIADRTVPGNVLLKVAGDAEQHAVAGDSLSFVYYRTGYALYPRRIYVAPADQVVNDGRDILRVEFSPSQEWLQEHDVRSVLTLGSDGAGHETLRLQILKPRDDRAGTPIDRPAGD